MLFPVFEDTVLHAAAGLGDVELMSFFMGYGVEAISKAFFGLGFWLCLRWIPATCRVPHPCMLPQKQRSCLASTG